MLLPLLLLAGAVACAAAVAYGVHPAIAQYPHGLDVILWSRRLEWPLATVSLILCIAIIALVVSGKRRAWWLIGLGPVLALFVHRYYSDPLRIFAVADNPICVAGEQAGFMGEDDYVVGITIGSDSFAYPAYCLYYNPVVVQSDHDKRFVLFWSAFANHAGAFVIARDFRARDLEVVSMPANALLVYNSRLGEFINGLTGLTPKQGKPSGVGQPLMTQKTTWKQWRSAHPQTQVMRPVGAATNKEPNWPVAPYFPMPRWLGATDPSTRIVLLPTTRPVAVAASKVSETPTNISAGTSPMVLFRDKETGRPRAYDARVEDLLLKFRINTDTRRRGVFMIDENTKSGWTADGKAIDGRLSRQGVHLEPVPVEEGLYWGAMKYWMPDLVLDEGRP